ncbi:MAG: glycosyl hydrolase family 17 [Saprospiraceae bacterium]|nr:glycosyl hydrolase family 17 [Saprospiraceae bacterium]
MKPFYYLILISFLSTMSCKIKEYNTKISSNKTAAQILGNPAYQAISYGGYRHKTRDIQPSLPELKEDLKIMYAMGIRILRTYNVHLAEASNLLQAIKELKTTDPTFEMYVMLGAWIDCKNAWTHLPVNHNEESENNEIEIQKAVQLANQYPDIVKIIAVGNEAMVKWATSYYVQPWVILKWVNFLQDLKKEGQLSKEIWITSSDNFASWGGGGHEYHVEDLNKLIRAVDYISMHTYPMHDTHYNPEFWGIKKSEENFSDKKKVEVTMGRVLDYATHQYTSVINYMKSIGVHKPVHIGETGWATTSNEHYGHEGSKATDEYKSALYYTLIKEWSNKNKVSCFYFEAFDEQWKDSANPMGSENHFGLITLQSKAKYALWDLVDQGVFKGLTRDGKPITKTFGGDMDALWKSVEMPPVVDSIKVYK